MTLEQSIEEAKMLRDIMKNLWADVYAIPKFKEGEVNFRAETLKGFICILQNDVFEMLKSWQEELNSK